MQSFAQKKKYPILRLSHQWASWLTHMQIYWIMSQVFARIKMWMIVKTSEKEIVCVCVCIYQIHLITHPPGGRSVYELAFMLKYSFDYQEWFGFITLAIKTDFDLCQMYLTTGNFQSGWLTKDKGRENEHTNHLWPRQPKSHTPNTDWFFRPKSVGIERDSKRKS